MSDTNHDLAKFMEQMNAKITEFYEALDDAKEFFGNPDNYINPEDCPTFPRMGIRELAETLSEHPHMDSTPELLELRLKLKRALRQEPDWKEWVGKLAVDQPLNDIEASAWDQRVREARRLLEEWS